MNLKIISSIFVIVSLNGALGWSPRQSGPRKWWPVEEVEKVQNMEEQYSRVGGSSPVIVEYNDQPRDKIAVLRKVANKLPNSISSKPVLSPIYRSPKDTDQRRNRLVTNNKNRRRNIAYKNRRKRWEINNKTPARADVEYLYDRNKIKKRTMPGTLREHKLNPLQTGKTSTIQRKRRAGIGSYRKRYAARLSPEKNQPREFQNIRKKRGNWEHGAQSNRMGNGREQMFEKRSEARVPRNMQHKARKFSLENHRANALTRVGKGISDNNQVILKEKTQNVLNYNNFNGHSNDEGTYKLLDKLVPGNPDRKHKRSPLTRQNDNRRSIANAVNGNKDKLYSKRSRELHTEATKGKIIKRNLPQFSKRKFLDVMTSNNKDDTQQVKGKRINSVKSSDAIGTSNKQVNRNNERLKDIENKASIILKRIEQLRKQIKNQRNNKRREKFDSEIEKEKFQKQNQAFKNKLNSSIKPTIQKSLKKEKTADIKEPKPKRETQQRLSENNKLKGQRKIEITMEDGFQESIERKQRHAKDMYKKFLRENDNIVETETKVVNVEEKEDNSHKSEGEKVHQSESLKEIDNHEAETNNEVKENRFLENNEIDFIIIEDVEIDQPENFDPVIGMLDWIEPGESDTFQKEAESIKTTDEQIDMYIDALKNIELEDVEIERFVELLQNINLDEQSIETWFEMLKKQQLQNRNIQEDLKIIKRTGLYNGNLKNNIDNQKNYYREGNGNGIEMFKTQQSENEKTIETSNWNDDDGTETSKIDGDNEIETSNGDDDKNEIKTSNGDNNEIETSNGEDSTEIETSNGENENNNNNHIISSYKDNNGLETSNGDYDNEIETPNGYYNNEIGTPNGDDDNDIEISNGDDGNEIEIPNGDEDNEIEMSNGNDENEIKTSNEDNLREIKTVNEYNDNRSKLNWAQTVNSERKTIEREGYENKERMKEAKIRNRENRKKEAEDKKNEQKQIKQQEVEARRLHKQLVNKKNRIKQNEEERIANSASTPPCSYEQRRGIKNICGCKFPDTCLRVYECTASQCSFNHTCMTPGDARHVCRPNSCKVNETCYLIRKGPKEFSAGCLLVDKTVVKPGICPILRNPYGSTETHNESITCLTDSDCIEDKKCCQMKELSKKMCTDPVADISKPGLCPPKEFLGLLSAHQLCQKDVDCPQCLKCCKGETVSHCYRPISKYEAERWGSLY